jgi:hypothetical protein
MDINYLVNTILPQREKEIIEGQNLATAEPIYVVLNLQENFIEGHVDFNFFLMTNYAHKEMEFGYIDDSLDSEHKEFKRETVNMQQPVEVTKLYTDRIVAFFLTSKAAHEYLQYQAHNLTNAYVYVFNCGYRNDEMKRLLRE